MQFNSRNSRVYLKNNNIILTSSLLKTVNNKKREPALELQLREGNYNDVLEKKSDKHENLEKSSKYIIYTQWKVARKSLTKSLIGEEFRRYSRASHTYAIIRFLFFKHISKVFVLSAINFLGLFSLLHARSSLYLNNFSFRSTVFHNKRVPDILYSAAICASFFLYVSCVFLDYYLSLYLLSRNAAKKCAASRCIQCVIIFYFSPLSHTRVI